MGLLNRIVSLFDDWHLSPGGSATDDPAINPATGLPMTGGIDVAGNPFGIDLSSHRHDDWQHDHYETGSTTDMPGSGWHDPFPTGMGGRHDPWRD
ncbi:hypothetical protein PQ455_20630 (plasmid) [Sphingomonas naphthae]|uniref:Uncharacterized protein n=1 Tax=Sphingomonas naphthae TaxID=1813468 RepID=A0ABY7TSG5_9SPHN|nr:hypothetical protein [Sphingomonas naphthae]WCT75885.1 hypothetical protein PQ455_20630 [Sphingomonas naphthae]